MQTITTPRHPDAPGRLYFPLQRVLSLVGLVLDAERHHSPTGPGSAPPGLVWVKDQGTYLMGNSEPPAGVVLWPTADSPDGLLLDGSDTSSADFGELYRATRRICGGDDFVHLIELTSELIAALRSGFAQGHQYFVLEPDGLDLELLTEYVAPTQKETR